MRLLSLGFLFVSTAAGALGWAAYNIAAHGVPGIGALVALIVSFGTLLAWLMARPIDTAHVAWCIECGASRGAWLAGFCTACGGTRHASPGALAANQLRIS